MSKRILFAVAIASMFIVSSAFALSIHIDLLDKDGKALTNANCLAVNEHKTGILFATDEKGKASLNDVAGKELNVHCQKDGKNHNAKVATNQKNASVKMEPKALIVMGDQPFGPFGI
ncbi:hypothetical protein OAO01_08440 [Oligoflexia bacterium]|nr:hypothetical protein [Oligoflexia bacterium]